MFSDVLCDMALLLATSSLTKLTGWFQTPLGRRLIGEQAPLVAEYARRFHGDTLLWVGCHTDLSDTVRGCMIRNRLRLSLHGATGSTNVTESVNRIAGTSRPKGSEGGHEDVEFAEFQSTLEDIPLPNSSLDAVVLHHVLEAAGDPRTAIRELSRVLAPGGRLLVCGFNPFSLWGIRGMWARIRNDGFSDLRFVSSQRLQDWLAVLGFELQQNVKYLAYGMPFPTGESDPKLWQRARARLSRHRIPVGGVYLISAVKQSTAVHPWRTLEAVRGRKLAPVAYPKLTARLGNPMDESGSH